MQCGCSGSVGDTELTEGQIAKHKSAATGRWGLRGNKAAGGWKWTLFP